MTKTPHTFVIAEAGVNHNGSLDMARRLIEAAVDAGADAVKFQTFKAGSVVSSEAPKAFYQTLTTGAKETQFEMLKKLELNEEAHIALVKHCRTSNIEFLSTPFDSESMAMLVRKFSLNRLKIPSGEITNGPLLLKAAKFRKPVILSTGMSTLGEIEAALGILAFGYCQINGEPSLAVFQKAFCSLEGQKILKEKVILLHCTSEYPAPFSEVNLRAMDTMQSAFGLPVGLSDHTLGIAVPIAAVARGAVVIEKHFTLDRGLSGPDHQASLEPHELKAMILAIRQVEEALGDPLKAPTPSELKNRAVIRRSLVVSRPIQAGEILGEEDLVAKRPADGESPLNYWDLVGKRAHRSYKKEERLK